MYGFYVHRSKSPTAFQAARRIEVPDILRMRFPYSVSDKQAKCHHNGRTHAFVYPPRWN